jgi:quinol monooxygenase YgiN
MIVRIFNTAVDPEDVDRGKQIFREQVKPVFEAFEGCSGIEWYIGVDEHSADLVNVAALSRWESTDAIERAVASPDYEVALSQLRDLFRQTPIVHHYVAAE